MRLAINCGLNLKNIILLGQELKDLYEDVEMRHSLRYLETESVRPQMKMSEIG